MEYADVVLGAIVIAYPLALAVLQSLGAGGRVSIGVASLLAAAVILHALFVNPPTE